MTSAPPSTAGPPDSPIQWSDFVGRRIRTDEIATLGTSSQTLAERAAHDGRWDVAADLAEYFRDEMTRINAALYTWLTVIFPARAELAGGEGSAADDEGARIVAAMQSFEPGSGDLVAVLAACDAQDVDRFEARLELMRVRIAAVHDLLVHMIQNLLSDCAERFGEQSVCDLVLKTEEVLWKVRYASWAAMTPEDRLRLSVEGMRGHLSGPRHRGDVGLIDEGDRYTMVLDPCGSCGVLRRGDPDSGRPSSNPAGPSHEHAWAWNRTDISWYAVHSAIVMQWLQARNGEPLRRPLTDCDSATAPCRWFIYKDLAAARDEHYASMGFPAPGDVPR